MKKLVFWLYRINLLVLLFWAMHAWPLWFLDGASWNEPLRLVYTFLTVILSLSYYTKYVNKSLSFKNRTLLIAFLLFLAFFKMYGGFLSVLTFLQYVPMLVMIEDYRNAAGHIKFITIVLSVILIPGIFLFIYHLTAGLPPSLPMEHPFSENYLYMFYGFYILNVSPVFAYDIPRFNSIFLEPGHLAVVLIGLLYARDFDLKSWVNKIMLFSLLLTFSLLGYVSLIVVYLYHIYARKKKKKIISSTFAFMAILSIVYGVAVSYNEGKNMVNELIVKRLQPDKEKGITGNDRNNTTVDNLYESMISSGEILYGAGNEKITSYFANDTTSGNAGYKLYLITHGLISAFLFLIIYLLIGPLQFPAGERRYALGFMIIVFFSFLSIGEPHSWMNLIPLALGLSNNKNEVLVSRAMRLNQNKMKYSCQ